MHEKVFRGNGGEISLENSIILCADCHILNPNQKGAHGGRQPRFSKKVLDKGSKL
jgi:5-methylcytosine-specific restriction endonuclease McrA